MVKLKTLYVCHECGAQFPKWMGQCSECNAWNCLSEEVQSSSTQNISRLARFEGYTGLNDSVPILLSDVTLDTNTFRLSTGHPELDRVLGNGLVAGSVVLIGGDPGIGKSTLLLQTLCQ